MDSCIELHHVSRSFGAITAITDVNLRVMPGEVRAMIGEHGAGKSTIARIMGGLIAPSTGYVECFGRIGGSAGTPFAGVEVVHQTTELMENLTVSENMFAANPKRFPAVVRRYKRLHSLANEYFREIGVDLRGEYLVSQLRRSDWVLIDVLRKLYLKPKLLVLDEAIEQLSTDTADLIIERLKSEQRRGMAIVYITHRVDDVYTFADTVSIVKNGTVSLTEATEDIDKINLIKMAYTQLSDRTNLDQFSEDFFHLLKYNEAILRKLPVSLLVFGRDEELKIINEAAVSLLNLDSRSGSRSLEAVFADSPEIVSVIKRSFASNEVRRYYYLPFKRADSEELLINISKVPIFDEHFLIGNILLLHDITEQERLREEFELRDKLAATGLLAAGVAHEINNPLGMILNDLHFLKMVSPDTRIQQRVTSLEKHFGFITNVVSNLLSFSNQSASEHQPVEVNKTIGELVELLSYYVRAENIELSFSGAITPMSVRVSENELKQILLNLIKNSIEALEDGGRIDLSAREAVVDGKSYALLEVADNGPGMPSDEVHDAFLPFRSSKAGRNANLGLGLSVSYNIVQKYNGRISVDSEPDLGCKISLLFPSVEPTT